MAVSEPPTREQDNSVLKQATKPREKKERPLTKVVIRRLPPSMNQDLFLTQVAPIPEFDYLYTVRGDASLGEHAFTRVYINFVQPEDIITFKEKFDNYVFVDEKGHEYPAVVEFAAFQKCPKKRKGRSDLKCGTIESDPYYGEFLESLKEQVNFEEKPEYSYNFSSGDNKEDVSTPLLDFVKQRRLDRVRIREERREERKRRETERKKFKDEERKRYAYEKSQVKIVAKSSTSKPSLENVEEAPEIVESKDQQVDGSPSKTKLYEEHKSPPKPKIKFRFPVNLEKREYLDRKSDYKNKRYEDFKRDTEAKPFPKKVAKKYSEKREERKKEARKFEQKQMEVAKSEIKEDSDKSSGEICKEFEPKSASNDVEVAERCETEVAFNKVEENKEGDEISSQDLREPLGKDECDETDSLNKENDPRVQRRIRNKDRPTMALYKPGMLSKKKPSTESNKSVNEK